MLKYAPGLAVVTLFSISLASANHAPTNVAFSVTKTIPHDGKSGTSGVTVELAPVAVDPDGDPMAFFWKCPASHTASVEVLTAVFPAAGSYTCELKVTDAYGATTTGAVSVTIITEPNATPVANAGADQTYTVPHDESPNSNTAACLLNGKASHDPDGDRTERAWNCGSGRVATGGHAVIDLPQGVHTCTLTVTDTYGASSTDQVQLTVNAEPNATPVANAGADQTYTVPHDFNPGTTKVKVTLDGRATSDADGDRMTHVWKCYKPKLVLTANLQAAATVRLAHSIRMISQGNYPNGIGSMQGDTFSGLWTHQENKVEVMLPAGDYLCRLTTQDTHGAVDTNDVNILVNAEPGSNPGSR